ncbi:MAG: hypothetical protein OEW45_05545 [Deltaproteobacteria bacterium]|nr:hypothetical protein [Deltaproteobacteria bacterium]
MTQSKTFPCPNSRFAELVISAQSWLAGEGFKCQKLQTEDGGTLLQIEKVGGWRKFVGMSTALNIVFRQVENTVNVEIGAGRWIDKAATGAVAYLILWPLALTAGIGAWQQLKMPERVFEHIATFLSPYAH